MSLREVSGSSVGSIPAASEQRQRFFEDTSLGKSNGNAGHESALEKSERHCTPSILLVASEEGRFALGVDRLFITSGAATRLRN